MNALGEIEYKGYTIKVYPDDDPLDPRAEFDPMGIIVAWHRRMNLGDIQPAESPEEWLKANISGYSESYLDDKNLNELWELFEKTNLVIPIMAYEHGGITIQAYNYSNWPDQQWDCGQLGFIYISHEQIRKEYNVKHMSKKTLDKAHSCLLSEIAEYDDYLTGNVYGFVIESPDGDDVDSCWGFYGDYNEYMIPECKSIIDSLLA